MVEVPPPVHVSDLPAGEPVMSLADNLWVLAVGVGGIVVIVVGVALIGVFA
ncbi:hypothetical protein [Glutamicibacter protophormiae]|uniref:hypothetical protein n=1 Tax=Glutamicibacter protophormiae TaxID=37930 RepID=UPI003A9288A0